MAHRARDVTASLGALAAAVEADVGAWFLGERGDGALEAVWSVAPEDERARTVAGAVARLARVLRGRRDPDTGALALVAVPDVRGGLLVLERRRAEPFSADDLAVARLFARQLAEQVITGERSRRAAWSSHLEAVQSVAAQLTRLTSVEEVATALCSHTHRVIGFDNARVYVRGADGVTLEPVAFRPLARDYAGETPDALRVRIGEGITGWVGATGQPLVVRDSAHDPRALDVPGSKVLPEESMLLAPLRSEGRVIGVVVLSRIGLDGFDDDDLRLLCVLADQAAVAIENARLLAARERLVTEGAALLDISRSGGEAAGEAALASLLASKLRAAARVDACLLWRLEDGSAQLTCLGSDGSECDGHRRDTLAERVTRQVLLQGGERAITGADADLDAAERERLAVLGAASVMLLPLAAAGRATGLVELVSRDPRRPFVPDELGFLRTMANQAAAVLENARLVERLRAAAETDVVSGVHSHSYLQERLRQETARAGRTHAPLSLLMVDLDGFKRINDVHGHQAGDRVLRAVGVALRDAVRANDIVARYGGDEFVVLMPDSDEAAAHHVANRVAATVAAVPHLMPDGSETHVSCSLGVALYPRDGRTGAGLMRAADAAMYAHKRARRSGAPGDRSERARRTVTAVQA